VFDLIPIIKVSLNLAPMKLLFTYSPGLLKYFSMDGGDSQENSENDNNIFKISDAEIEKVIIN
jgi:hypothetical protein